MKRMMSVVRCEAYGRVAAILVLVLTVVLIGTNRETKTLFQVLTKTATFHSVDIFVLQLYVDVIAAVYNLVQLIRCLSFSGHDLPNKPTEAGNHLLLVPWLTFLIDQMTVYVVLGTNCASTMASGFAVTGNRAMQWQKLCHIYTRFCVQAVGFLFCGFVASIVLACISSISAYNLFRFYSPNHFLSLKINIKNKKNTSTSTIHQSQ